MVDANKLLRIFWPSDAPRGNTQGVILGWRNSEFDLFVISILHEVEVKPSEIPRLLSVFTEPVGIVVSGGTCTADRHLVAQQSTSRRTTAAALWKYFYARAWDGQSISTCDSPE